MKTCACITPAYPIPGLDRGWGNGYVLVSKNHKLYGKCWDDDDFPAIDVHGGVTWASPELPGKEEQFEFITEKPESIDGWWVFGFDTAHFRDGAHIDKEFVKYETQRFREIIEQME